LALQIGATISSGNSEILISKINLVRFFVAVDSQTSFTLWQGVGDGVGNFGKVGFGK